MALLPPNNPANAFGVGSYLTTPRWFLGLPVVTTLTGLETVYSVQSGVDVQVPLSLIPLVNAVESVSFVAPSIFTVSGSPILPGGPSTITLGLAPEAQSSAFLGPSSGGAGMPTFRPIVAADLPTIPVSVGGTGLTTLTAHAVLLGEGTANVAFATPGAANFALLSTGAAVDPTFQQITAPIINYTPAGAHGATRTVQSKESDWYSVLDTGTTPSTTTLANAVTDLQTAGGGTLLMPNGSYTGVALPASYSNVALHFNGPLVPVSLFGEAPGAQFIAGTATKYMDNSAHAGHGHSAVSIETYPIGTGAVGPLNADYALTLSVFKQGAGGGGSPVQGEIDCMYIVSRNDGVGTQNDTTGFLMDIANYSSGFNAGYEIHTSTISVATTTSQIALQAAVINNRDGGSWGYVYNATVGAQSGAQLMQNQGTGRWGFLQQFVDSTGVIRYNIPVDSNQVPRIQLKDSAGVQKTMRVNSGKLSFLNSAETTEIFTVDDSGNGVFNSNLTAAIGTFASLSVAGLISPSSTAGIKGTVAADNANAGSWGEYVTANASAVSLTSGTTANVTSISLTAGDWDVSGTVIFSPAGTTTTSLAYGGISTTSATIGGLGSYFQDNHSEPAGAGSGWVTPIVRVSIGVTTTVYLVSQAVFATSTMTVAGLIRARRVR